MKQKKLSLNNKNFGQRQLYFPANRYYWRLLIKLVVDLRDYDTLLVSQEVWV